MVDDASRHGESPSPISGNNGGAEEIDDEVTQHLDLDVKEEDRDMVRNSTERQQPLEALDAEAQGTEERLSDVHLYRVSRFCCQHLLGVVDNFVERFTSAPLEEALFYRQEQEGVEQTAEVGERKEPSSHLLKRLTERDKPLGETMAHFLARLHDIKQEMQDILKDLSDREESGGPAHPLSSSEVDGVAEGREGQQIGNRRSVRSKRRLLDTLYFMCETSNANLLQMSRVSLGDCRDPGSALRLCPLDCSMLVGALMPLGIIEEVNLSHCCIGPEGLQQLSSILHRCKSLRLSWNNLGDSGVKILCSSLRESLCEIQELWVDNNGLTGVGTKNLAYAIAKNQSLLLLSLSYNRIEEASMKLLCNALRRRSCTIQHLQLSGTGITSAYCRQLAWALSTNRSLTVLDLDNNHLGDSGVSLLCGALMKPDCKIQNLRLSSNRLTALCTLELTRVLSTNRSLRRLSVSYNRLGTTGLRRLSAALKAPACPLQRLELDDNGLRDACAEELAVSLSRNRWLKGLYLNRNCFTDQSIPAFQQLAESCISLKYIWLCRNQFSAEGQSKLQSLEESAHRVTIFV